ncbi:hypothetical protein CAEBREN_10826 [Caenorhabditis brenneri]|uniref:Uncharacterized protein n=1 Tax=Caenorhabditis brenneri TaxID=135651 RepID=G0P2C9_CAEBE|nr:hypothetical protein CAEBREN_10826 [Caenorhabditis brenneri]
MSTTLLIIAYISSVLSLDLLVFLLETSKKNRRRKEKRYKIGHRNG